MLTPNELVFTFGGFYVCADFGENRSRNATVRMRTDGQTDSQTDRRTNRFYNLSHAIWGRQKNCRQRPHMKCRCWCQGFVA